jgi:hypothetical protein
MAKVMFEAEMPAKHLQEFLQALRDAECKHFNEIVVKYSVDAPDVPVEQARALFASIKPPFDDLQIGRLQ